MADGLYRCQMNSNEIARTGADISGTVDAPTGRANEKNSVGAKGSRRVKGSGIAYTEQLCGVQVFAYLASDAVGCLSS